MEKSGPTHHGWEGLGQTTNPVGTQPRPSANSLPRNLLGTQLPLITPRDKAPPTKGIRISSTYQWAGTSLSHQEACSKPLYQLQPQGGRHKKQVRVQPYALQKHNQNLYKMKRQRITTQIRQQENNPEKQQSDLRITNLHKKDFRLMIVKT